MSSIAEANSSSMERSRCATCSICAEYGRWLDEYGDTGVANPMSAINPAPPLFLESEGDGYLEKGMEAEAISSFAAAALMGRWEGWLRIAMLLERRAKFDNGALSLFFRERYREAVEAAVEAGDNEAAHRTVGLYEFG